MTDQTDFVADLALLAQEADELRSRGERLAVSFPDATTENAVRMLGQAASGFRRAIERIHERAEREAARLERMREHTEEKVRKAEARKYDEITRMLAQRRGISLEEAQAIRDEAAREAARVAGLGSIDQQLAEQDR